MAMNLFATAISSAIGEAFNREQIIRFDIGLFADISRCGSTVHGPSARVELRFDGRLVRDWWNHLLVLLPSAGC